MTLLGHELWFAPDLIYSIPEVAQGTRETLCANLTGIFAESDVKLRYANPDVHEIVVAGDVAVVRLTWTLTTERSRRKDTTTEEGMDMFRRQADGRWSIARFVAFRIARTGCFDRWRALR